MSLKPSPSHRTATRIALASLRVIVALAGMQLLWGAASASAATQTPSANIPMTALPSACNTAPTGPACTDAVVAGLDRGRADLGLGPYMLPADFDSLPGDRQLFVLSNLDRIAYGLAPITGLSPTLDRATASAMNADVDPDPTSVLGGLGSYAWSSNWAGQWANAPYAYYEWMYDDGYGGSETTNIDCTSPTAPGCWDHRRDVLAFPGVNAVAMGASVGTDAQGNSSYTMTLVASTSTTWTTYSYTWSQAQIAGAGAGTSASPAHVSSAGKAARVRAHHRAQMRRHARRRHALRSAASAR